MDICIEYNQPEINNVINNNFINNKTDNCNRENLKINRLNKNIATLDYKYLNLNHLTKNDINKNKEYSKFFNDREQIIVLKNSNSNKNCSKTKERLIAIIPSLFKNILSKNGELNEKVNTIFDISSSLNINFQDYLLRLMKHTDAESNTIIYALSLLDALCDTNKICLTYKNIHKMFFISLILSVKLLEDFTFADSHYAKCGGVSLNEYLILESAFLYLLDYKTFISEEKFYLYKKFIIN